MSPAELTLRFFRGIPYEIAIVEKTVNVPRPGGRRLVFKQDLWGFADGLAFRPGVPCTIAVQWTVGARFAEHVEKCQSRDREIRWTDWGGSCNAALLGGAHRMARRLLVFGWREVGAAGTRKHQQARVVEIRAGVACPEVSAPDAELAKILDLVP